MLSSWGFLLLGSPILLAYGVVAHAPWYYYLMLLPYLLAFIHIPVAIGAIICLCRWCPHPRRPPGGVDRGGGVLLLAGAVGGVVDAVRRRERLAHAPLVPGVLGRLPFSEKRLLPSWWLSSGLLSGRGSDWSDSLLFLALMISNALFFRQLACWTAARLFRASYSGLYGRSLRRRRARPRRFDRGLSAALGFLPATVRLLILKDLRLFRRDPLQWSQFLIFLGLLALYFLNIRRFMSGVNYAGWVNMISFLNLAVVGLLLVDVHDPLHLSPDQSGRPALLGSRPVAGAARHDSLEQVPVCRRRVDHPLHDPGFVKRPDPGRVQPGGGQPSGDLRAAVPGTVGDRRRPGRAFPNFREQSPSRIAAGFGGTLNLVVSTLYILVVVLLTAVPTHFYLAAHDSMAGSAGVEKFAANIDKQSNVQWASRYSPVSRVDQPSDVQRWLELWLGAGTLGSILLGAVATGVPLYVGFRAFRRMDF